MHDSIGTQPAATWKQSRGVVAEADLGAWSADAEASSVLCLFAMSGTELCAWFQERGWFFYGADRMGSGGMPCLLPWP